MKTYSHSKIKLWDECELKFCAHELLKLKPENNLSTDPKIQIGSLVHRFFYEFYKNQIQTSLFRSEQISLLEWKALFSKEWELMKPRLIFSISNQQNAYLERGLQALENFYVREKKSSFRQPIYLEQKFTVNLGQFSLSGIIDRVDREEDGSLTVIDYKIADQIQSASQADKDLQLSIYHLACQQSLVRETPARLALYYPLQNEVVYSSRKEEDMQEMLQKISLIDQDIMERGANPAEYKTSPLEWKCESCGYRAECPEFKFEHSLELPSRDEMLDKANEYAELKKQLAEIESKTESLKAEIKDYMLQQNVKRMGPCALSSSQGTQYDPIIAWKILKLKDDGYQYIKSLDSASIEEHWQDFSLQEKEVLNKAKTKKAIIHQLRLPKG
jgi:RecB family exonuclease